MMMKTFHFVDGIQADKTSKRLMRRHVMKGKNVGKRLHRPSRLGLQGPQRQPDFDETTVPSRVYEDLNSVYCVSLPMDVPQASVKIINEFFALTADRIYPVRLGISLHDTKVMWLQALFTDEATYRCNIALMQACNEIFLSDGGSPPKALYHLSQTFAQVKKRLESDDALSDSTIAIVLSLIHQEQIRKQQSAAMIHYKGLVKMIELRGGLSQLEGNISLVLKICKTDIVLSLQQGWPTVFFRDHMPEFQEILASKGISSNHNLPSPFVLHNQMDPYLYQVFLDIMDVCSLFNNNLHSFLVDLQTFQETIISLCYRLLLFRSLADTRKQCDVQSAYHIGLLTFMMTLFLQHDGRQIVDFRLISLCLRDILDSRLDEHDGGFRLWLVTISGIWISEDAGGEWLAPKMRTVAQRLGISTWGGVRSSVSKYPWINDLHDQPGRRIWDKIDHSQ